MEPTAKSDKHSETDGDAERLFGIWSPADPRILPVRNPE